jgi:hypothetical protein
MLLTRRHFSAIAAGAPASAFAQTPGQPDIELDWHDARKFTVEGLGYKDRKAPYDRFPGRAEDVVPPVVWGLSRHSAGVLVRFVTNTPTIRARWSVTAKQLSGANMTPIAASGLDLYAKTGPAKWHWLAVGRPSKLPENTDTLISGMPKGEREYMLYFPLWTPTTSVEIGLPKGTEATPGQPRAAGRKPIVFYGTSITHGASASRGGMTHVSMLGRWFDREVINLGFSGNGRMEPEVVKFVNELDPAVFVLDCLPNMTAVQVRERAAPAVQAIREAHPTTPILLVEDRLYADNFLNPSRRERNETNHAALREVYAKLRQDKVPHLLYLKGEELLSADGEDTIDGSHPTDLGFLHQARAFERVLRPVLK